MQTVTLYTKTDCSLCDQVKADLAAIQDDFPHTIVEIDIASDQALIDEFGQKVPVVEIGPYKREAPITRQDLTVTLGAAQHRVEQLEKVDDPKFEARKRRGQTLTKADRFSYWFSKRWIWVINLAVLIYVGLPFLAPVLMNAGVTGPATVIYRGYGFVCHQLAYRSWFLFGDQVAYPRAAAQVEALETYGQRTGLGEGGSNAELLGARGYVGEEGVGYKVAFCERDVAIYAAILVFGLIFAFTGRRLPPLPWYLWALIGVVPIGLDGFSQLLSQPPFELWAYRESTPLLRTLTGALFGVATAWFGIPLVEETMEDTRKTLRVKIKRLDPDSL
jgi:uncharacterized membrane protein